MLKNLKKKIKEITKTEDLSKRPFGDGDEKQLKDYIFKANLQLSQANENYKRIIAKEVREIRYSRDHNLGKANEARHIAKVKQAYYSMGVINAKKEELNDLRTTTELFKAMNDITSSIKVINKVYAKTEKPNVKQYQKVEEKFQRNLEDAEQRLGTMYENASDLGQLVSDDLVESLVGGASVESNLYSNKGINVPVEEIGQFDFSNIDFQDIGQSSSGSSENFDFDFSKIDFSDL